MKLKINGEIMDVPDSIACVTDLLGHFGLQEKLAMVEWNEVVLERSRHAQTRLSDGDRLEIVHFVGGG